MKLLRLTEERGGETCRRVFLRGRGGGRSDGFVTPVLSAEEKDCLLVRFRVDVAI